MSVMPEQNEHMQQTNRYDFFSAAQRSHSIVKVVCCIEVRGALKDIACCGYLKNVEGREADLECSEVETLVRPPKLYPNELEYFFKIDKTVPYRARMGFKGTGRILEIKRNEEGNIVALRLRFASRYFMRRLRCEQRVDWNKGYSKASGILHIDHFPETKLELKELIEHHVHTSGNNLQIVNISASGLCAIVPDESELKKISSDPDLLFYVISDEMDVADAVYIFLCKKVGVTSGDEGNTIKVRLQFTHELDMNNDSPTLKWNEISGSGSTRLREFIQNNFTPSNEESTAF